MLTPIDQLGMRQELSNARLPYRETMVFIPTISSGSNYEQFTDSPYDIAGSQGGQYTATFVVYRLYARVKIIKDTTLIGFSQVVPGIEVGDYLMYFRDGDKLVLDEVTGNQNAYLKIDGLTMRPYNTTLNGVGQTFDVFVHAKKYSPKYIPQTPQGWVIGTGIIGTAYVS